MQINSVNGSYLINKVTDKAVLIESTDGKWIDNGKFIPIWLPISQLTILGVIHNPQNSVYGVHVVAIPEWLVSANSKKW